MAVSLTSGSFGISINWNAQATNTGAPATTNSGSWNPKLAFTNGSSAGNAADIISAINTLSAAATSTYDLTSAFADLVGTAAVNIATVRTVLIWLLSTAQTGPDGATVGTAATSITVGNAATVQAFTAATPAGFFGATTTTINIPNGGFAAFGVANAGGFTVGASYKNLKVLNNDGANVATFAIMLFNT